MLGNSLTGASSRNNCPWFPTLGVVILGTPHSLGVTLHVHIPPRREEAFYAYSLRVEGILVYKRPPTSKIPLLK
jgi:hypothetical protein